MRLFIYGSGLISINHAETMLLNQIFSFLLCDLPDLLIVLIADFENRLFDARIKDEPLMIFDYDHMMDYFVPVLPKPPVLSVSERSSVSSHWTVSTLWNVICAMRVPALIRNFQDSLL